jgi:hypothetical protein
LGISWRKKREESQKTAKNKKGKFDFFLTKMSVNETSSAANGMFFRN